VPVYKTPETQNTTTGQTSMQKPILTGLFGLTLAACTPTPDVGRAIYNDNCTACHGVSGKGDGPNAADLTPKPADLSTLSARNGGEFPQNRVMTVIDGYARQDQSGNQAGDAMPEFGAFIHGPTTLVDTGDGVLTPTPVWLADVADYLRTLQQ
jgi:mono/diheme cytochrome c family protein